MSNSLSSQSEFHIWINLSDKGNYDIKKIESSLTNENKKRRLKLGKELVDYSDIPVNYEYIETIKSMGFKVKHLSGLILFRDM